MHDEDDGLLQRVAEGSPEAFEALYDRYCRLAYAIAMRVLADAHAADEVVQEAFLAVWRKRLTYHVELGTPRTWIATIVRNRAIDHLRRCSRRDMYELATDVPVEHAALSDTWAEVSAELSRQEIQAALLTLPIEQRQTIELAYWCGLSQSEISEQMHVPIGTVKGRARLGLLKLRGALEREEEPWPNR